MRVFLKMIFWLVLKLDFSSCELNDDTLKDFLEEYIYFCMVKIFEFS
jgi:hypothetical protein